MDRARVNRLRITLYRLISATVARLAWMQATFRRVAGPRSHLLLAPGAALDAKDRGPRGID
jgi:hypothetical protein